MELGYKKLIVHNRAEGESTMTTTTVMCTWCETTTTEEQLEIRLDTEHCPQCRVSGWLMNVGATQ